MSISVLVEIGNGDKQLNDISNDAVIDYNTLVRQGKKAIYDTRTYKSLNFSALYKPVFPNDVVFINDKILGQRKGIVQAHNITIQDGIIRSNYTIRCDYE